MRYRGAKNNLTVQTSKTVKGQQNRALAAPKPYVGMARALSISRNHLLPIRRFAMTKRSSALLAALFASLMLSQAPAHADGLEDVVKRGVLKVAVPQDFPPFGSVGPDMKPRGLDIDTAKLLADQLKVKLELTPVNSTNRIPFLTTGKVDLVISSLGKNPEREKVIDFSRAYAPFYLAVFGPPDADIKSLDDLKGKTISVTRGAIEDIELTKVAPEGVTIKRFEDNNSTIAAYLAGQVDLIASGNVVMVAISEKSPKRVPALKVKLKDSPVYVGVNKNEPALLDKVNQILVTAKSDGALEKNALAWLKEPLPADL
ncbi:periplasmic component of amino acid ABC-type transporter/signal transduction system [Pseudomonas sp. GM48]|nr:periplasmic component of amino acid ABC-type transporter/signal transduction system [Pseudomonas sp. GM48]